MKKLSEIGLNRDTFIENFSAYFADSGPMVILTASDRRELVTEAIKRWEAYRRDVIGPGRTLEEFLKEQGL